MAKTYYEDLGLEPTATSRDIKRQYRAMARLDHPDAASGSDEAFVKLTAAYDTLIDPEKRAAYDRKIAKPAPVAPEPKPKPTPPPPPPTSSPWWRQWTVFRAVVAAMVLVIVILIIRVGANWGGGFGTTNIPAITPDKNAAVSPSPSPSTSPTPSPTDTPSPTPTDTPTPTPSDSPSPTPTGEGVVPSPTVSPL